MTTSFDVEKKFSEIKDVLLVLAEKDDRKTIMECHARLDEIIQTCNWDQKNLDEFWWSITMITRRDLSATHVIPYLVTIKSILGEARVLLPRQEQIQHDEPQHARQIDDRLTELGINPGSRASKADKEVLLEAALLQQHDSKIPEN